MIEKTVLAQTEDQYCCATAYIKECALYGFQKQTLNNEKYYDSFNTKVGVGVYIGIARQRCVLMEDMTQETLERN